MIWDFIRDFIVQNITGGTLSDGSDVVVVGLGEFTNGDDIGTPAFPVGYFTNSNDEFVSCYVGFSDWLATTITAVIMVLMVVLACLLVRWVFKLVVNGFLLKR